MKKCINSWIIEIRIFTAVSDLRKSVPTDTFLLHKLMALHT